MEVELLYPVKKNLTSTGKCSIFYLPSILSTGNIAQLYAPLISTNQPFIVFAYTSIELIQLPQFPPPTAHCASLVPPINQQTIQTFHSLCLHLQSSHFRISHFFSPPDRVKAHVTQLMKRLFSPEHSLSFLHNNNTTEKEAGQGARNFYFVHSPVNVFYYSSGCSFLFGIKASRVFVSIQNNLGSSVPFH